MNQIGFPLLSILIVLPLLGALILALFFSSKNERIMRGWTLAIMVVTFLFSLLLWVNWRPISDMQYVENAPWVPRLGLTYLLGVDGISLFLVLLTTFLMPVVMLSAGHTITQNVKAFLCLMLVLEAAVVGVFAALDLVLFFIFWEAMLIPMYFLIGVWGGGRRRYAAIKFFIYTMAGSALMLVGILSLAAISYHAGNGFTFSLMTLHNLKLDPAVQMWLFGVFALAFAVKAPLFPLHTWLPDAYYEAPTPVTAIMAAVLSKMGVYGFLRLCLPLFPSAVPVFAPILGTLAVIGVVYGSLIAIAQKDAKMLVSYSSLAHISLIVLGSVVFNTQTVQGVILQAVNHGLIIATLFLLLGILYQRRGTYLMTEMGGLWKPMPTFGVLLLIAMLASAGVPGLNGFVGEFVILTGVFQVNTTLAVCGALGIILGAWYMFNLFRQTMQGPLIERVVKKGEPAPPAVHDVTPREAWALVPLIVLFFLFGLFPNLVFDPTQASASKLVDSVQNVIAAAQQK